VQRECGLGRVCTSLEEGKILNLMCTCFRAFGRMKGENFSLQSANYWGHCPNNIIRGTCSILPNYACVTRVVLH